MAQPAVQTGRLRGEIPETFTGDRKKSETFMQQFNVHWGLNENHEIMATPYLCAMYALSFMKGPLINDWVNDQVTTLRDKVQRTINPIPRDRNVLWTEFNNAFTAAYTDTAKQQNAYTALQHLKMKGNDVDTYTFTFKHLAKEAGYMLDAVGTVNLYACGMEKGLLDTVLQRETQPITMQQ